MSVLCGCGRRDFVYDPPPKIPQAFIYDSFCFLIQAGYSIDKFKLFDSQTVISKFDNNALQTGFS